MRRMLALAVAGCLPTGIVGCATNEMDTRREVKTAALSQYPGGTAEASQTYKLAAVDYQSTSEVEVQNLNDNAVPAGKLWVNGRYVYMLPGVPARGNVKLKYTDLLESGGGLNDLATAKGKVAKIELQVGEKLYLVQGPTIK